jgi:hypothetical protein
MRPLPLLLLLTSPGAALHAQWTNNTLLNTSVRSGSGVDAVTPLMTNGPDGSTYVSWFDNQPGGYQLRMQRLDVNGNAMWAAEGVLVSDHPQNSALFRYDLKTDLEGNAIVAFQDERSGQLDIVVYKVDPAGSPLWTADGVPLTDPASTQGLAPVIGVLTSNEVVIAWNASDDTDKWVAMYHLLADGSVPFSDPYRITGQDKYSRPKVIATGGDGCYVQYVQEVGNFPFTCTMYAQRFDGDGNVVGTYMVSTKTISAFYFPEPVSDGVGGFYLAFTTSNPDNQALSDVYVQHMDPTGTTWSDTGTEAAVGATTQKFTPGCVLLPAALGVMVPMQVTNSGQSQGGISVQRLDANGVVQLAAAGVEVLPFSADLPSPDDAAATSDGAIVVYSAGGFGNEHLSAVRLDASGGAVWSPASTLLCSANSNKDDAACGTFVNGQLVAVWDDDRSGNGVFAQNILGDGTTGIATGVAEPSGTAVDLHLQMNPSDHPTLVFGRGYAGLHTIMVLDMRGSTVLTERTSVTEAALVPLRTESLAPGLYAILVDGPMGVRALRWVKE